MVALPTAGRDAAVAPAVEGIRMADFEDRLLGRVRDLFGAEWERVEIE